MRVFITVLVLIFSLQSWTKADDISDFEIEGMSIGDSLLDYFSEDEINMYKVDIGYNSDKYETIQISPNDYNIENYDAMHINFLKNDKKIIIHAVAGMKDYDLNNIDECYKKKNEISKQLDHFFKKIPKSKTNKQKHAQDPSGKSFTTGLWINFPSGDRIIITCYDWSEELGWTDHLRLGMINKEFMDFINNEAYD